MTITVGAIIVLLIAGATTPEAYEAPRPRSVGVYEATDLVKELRPAWYLLPKLRGEKPTRYLRDGEKTPKGLAIGGYTLLVAPYPKHEEYVPFPEYRWKVCLVNSEKEILWETETGNLTGYDLAITGSVAIAERAGAYVVMLRVLDSSGGMVYSDVWLSEPPKVGRWGPSRDPRKLKFSPTGNWLVFLSTPSDGLGNISEERVRVFECSTGEEWEVLLESCNILQVGFSGPKSAWFSCEAYDENGQNRMLGFGEKHEQRTLDLGKKVVR